MFIYTFIIEYHLTRYRPLREEKGYGRDELDLKLVDLCGSSSSVGNDIH
jgi:hypothetical protein